MVGSLLVVCLLLSTALGCVGWWALLLGRQRAALAQHAAALGAELGEVASQAERLRAIGVETERLKAECREVAVRRATASEEFTAYARDLALRRETSERDFRSQCEADSRALEAHRASLGRQRAAAERELDEHLAALGERRAAADAEFAAAARRRLEAPTARARGGLEGRNAQRRRAADELEELTRLGTFEDASWADLREPAARQGGPRPEPERAREASEVAVRWRHPAAPAPEPAANEPPAPTCAPDAPLNGAESGAYLVARPRTKAAS